jgi:type I restriction enzyme S subunit
VDVCIIRPDPNIIDASWLMRALNSPSFQRQISKFTTGTTRKRISRKNLQKLCLPLPPLEEQRRIVEMLDLADETRRNQQESIRLTEEALRSAFLEMFGDPVTNPMGWDVVGIAEPLTFLTSGSRGWAKYYSNRGSIFLRIQNVGRNQLLTGDLTFVEAPDTAEAKRTLVQEGDVLLSITADLGRTAVIPQGFGPAHINQHLAILRLNKDLVAPLYASAFLASVGGQRQFHQLNKGGVKAGLNFDDIRSLNLLLPPLERQLHYVKFYDLHGNTVREAEVALEQLDTLFNALVQAAFRGELTAEKAEEVKEQLGVL